jgi:hypothetical protein
MSNAVGLYRVTRIQRDTVMETGVVIEQKCGNKTPKVAGNTSETLVNICQTTRYHNFSNTHRHWLF